MPLVTINILEGRPESYAKAIADAVNRAVIETMGFPEDDRYQVINECAQHGLQYQDRTEERVMMHLVMRAGRADSAKKAFYARVVEYLADDPGIAPENVLISITENHDIDWSFHSGLAQFVPDE